MADEVDISSELSKLAKLNGDSLEELRHVHRSVPLSPHYKRRSPEPLVLGRLS